MQIKGWFVWFACLLSLDPAHAATLSSPPPVRRSNDPDVARAGHLFASASEQVREARARLLPSLTFRVGWVAWWADPSSGLWLPAAPWDARDRSSRSALRRSFGVAARVPVFDRAAKYKLRATEARSSASAARFAAEKARLGLAVSLARLRVKHDRERAVLAREQMQALSGLADLAHARLDVGLAAVAEVYEAEATLATAKAREIAANVVLKDAQTHLAQLSLGAVGDIPTSSNPGRLGPLRAPGHWGATVACALKHPSLAALEYDVAASQMDIDASRASRLPTVRIDLGYELAATWSMHGAYAMAGRRNSGRPVASVSLLVKWPLFDGRKQSSSLREALAQRDAQQSKWEQERRGVLRDLNRYRSDAASSLIAATASRQSVASTRSAVDAARIGLSGGTSSWRELLAASIRLTEAQMSEVDTRYDLAKSSIKLSNMVNGHEACQKP